MSSDIERFLLQAAQRRRDRAAREAATQKPRDVEIIDAAPPPRSGKRHRVDEQVAQYLDTSQFTDRAAHLGEQVGMADELSQSRLKETFEHQLGQLGEGAAAAGAPASGQSTPPADRPAASPINIAQLLRSPQSVRQAIVLSEILTRPEDR